MTTSDQLEEYWDVYNRELQIVGQMQRKDAVPADCFHLAVGVIVFDAQHRVLVQRRSMMKANHPGLWEFGVGGSALRGESGAAAAARELHEEVKLVVLPTQLTRITRQFYPTWIEEWFAVQVDFKLAAIKLQASEVAEVQVMDVAAAQTLMNAAGIRPYATELQAACAAFGIGK